MSTYLEKITNRDLLDFGSQIDLESLNISQDGDRLFPNMKTKYLKAEFSRLAKSPTLPYAAPIHGFDTEAVIGRRPTAEIVRMEQLLIKEKLPLYESEQRYLSQGVTDSDQILQYIYDDMGNLARAVWTRAQVEKFEVFCTGKMIISENGVNLEVDYGVPDSNRYNLDWADNGADILGDLRRIVTAGKKLGINYNRAMTSQKILDYMVQNKRIQIAVSGANNAGVMITETQLNNLLSQMFGFTLSTNDEWYEYEKSAGSAVSARFFDEDKFILYAADNNGAVGTGLWGTTVEERTEEAFTSIQNGYNGFITISTWATPDPPEKWTKASGVFVPVLPNPKGLAICTIADGLTSLRDIDVETTPSPTNVNGSVVHLYPAAPATSGNTYAYKVGSSYANVSAGDTIDTSDSYSDTSWTEITDGTEITVSGRSNNKITVIEVSGTSKATAVGKALIHKK